MNHKASKEQRARHGDDLHCLYLDRVAAAPLVSQRSNLPSSSASCATSRTSPTPVRRPPARAISSQETQHPSIRPLSSGVHLATTSGMLAAAGIASAVYDNLDEQGVAMHYDAAYRMAYTRFLVLVSSLIEKLSRQPVVVLAGPADDR